MIKLIKFKIDYCLHVGWELWFPILLSLFLFPLNYYNYLLFHTLAELFSVGVSLLMATVAWQTYPFSRNNFLMFLACGYFWIGALDLTHTLVFKGINILPIAGTNVTSQFWIVVRYFEALLLLMAPFFINYTVPRKSVFVGFGSLAVLLYAFITTQNFPDTFIDGKGLTLFKIVSEYTIIIILIGAFIHMKRKRPAIGDYVFSRLALAIVLTIFAELSFTLYISMYDIFNALGHILKFLSFWLIFIAIIRTSLREPYVSLEEKVDERTQLLTREIAERQKTMDMLQKKEEQLEEAQKIAKLGYWTLDLRTNNLKWSDEIFRIFNVDKENFKASYEAFLEAVHPEDRELVNTSYTDSLKTKSEYAITHRLLLKDRTIKYVTEKCKHEFDENGVPILSIGTVQDITELKKAEDELKGAKEAAEASNQAKSIFLANISHEIRTPMNAVLGYTEILKSEESDPKKIQYIESIHLGGKALFSLINDILDISTVKEGKLELQYSAVSIDKMLTEIRVIFEQKISNQDLEFIIEKSNDVPQLLILDEARIRQILINLLSNAVKFTNSGFIKLIVSSSNTVCAATRCVDLNIIVEDSGIGIPEEQCKNIFDAFEQVKGEKTKEYGGTGLGLAITRQVVELMNGKIHCDSIFGKGSAFNIELNNVEIATAEKVGEKEIVLDENGIFFDPASILIVDDIEYNRKLIATFIKQWEFSIIEAENGVVALEQARNKKTDLILLNMKMPEMDGYEMCEHLNKDENLKDIPVIALTASALKQDEEIILKLCDGFLRKPINRTNLIRELMKHLPHTVAEVSKEVELEPIPLSKIIFPSHEKLTRIINASKAGNVTELEKCIAEMRDMDFEYQPFVDKIELWRHKFQFKEIIDFLQQHLEKG